MSPTDWVTGWLASCPSGESLAYEVVVSALIAGAVFRVVGSLLYAVTVGRNSG